MGEASIRELRNNGAAVVERVCSGERVVVTRDGMPVAELRPLPRRPLSLAVLLERFAALPAMDERALRADIDSVLDQAL
jgi:prevent-host-death family protein